MNKSNKKYRKKESNKENINTINFQLSQVNDENNCKNILKFSKKIVKMKRDPIKLRKHKKSLYLKYSEEDYKCYIRTNRLEKKVLTDMTNKILFEDNVMFSN